MWKLWIGEGFGQLDLALAAAAAEDGCVPIGDAADGLVVFIDEDKRVERVIGLAGGIQGFYTC